MACVDLDLLVLPGMALALSVWAVVMIVEEVRLRSRGKRDERWKADLRRRAPLERGAAKQLRKVLLHELHVQQAVRKDLETDLGTRDDRASLLQNLERAEQTTRDELARVEMWLGRSR